MLFVGLREILLVLCNVEIQIIGVGRLKGGLERLERRRADGRGRQALVLIGVIRAIALQVVGGNLAAGDIHHGRIAIEVAQAIELARQTVIENRCHMRALIGVEALALDYLGMVNDVIIGHLYAIALLDLGLAAGKVKRRILGLKLVKHGANHIIGRRVLTQRISLGE